METKDINKQEYQLRINKVTDYIHNHIDQPLSLQKMAGIACFSPFHFHRVFTILTGETPTDYIKRTRIEKAALLLQNKTLKNMEKENKILIFRTSITQRRDIKRIGELLAEFPQIDKWNVDFEDWEKILRIECRDISALEISEVLRNNHIFATELE